MKYFTNINTLDELKAAYRRLAMQHHPDRGGESNKNGADGINIMLSRLHKLFRVVNDEPITSSLIKLNQIGETVAQAEFDRRFDMYMDLLAQP